MDHQEGNDDPGTCTLVLVILHFGTLAVAVLQRQTFQKKQMDKCGFHLLPAVRLQRPRKLRSRHFPGNRQASLLDIYPEFKLRLSLMKQ